MNGGHGRCLICGVALNVGFAAIIAIGFPVPYVLIRIGRYVDPPLCRLFGYQPDNCRVAQLIAGALLAAGVCFVVSLSLSVGLLVMSAATGQSMDCLLGANLCAS